MYRRQQLDSANGVAGERQSLLHGAAHRCREVVPIAAKLTLIIPLPRQPRLQGKLDGVAGTLMARPVEKADLLHLAGGREEFLGTFEEVERAQEVRRLLSRRWFVECHYGARQ